MLSQSENYQKETPRKEGLFKNFHQNSF